MTTIENQKENRYSIKVCVRMRPRGAGSRGHGSGGKADGVVLPLHQRLQIIKAQRGGCSTGEAMKVLMEESGKGKDASKSPWETSDAVASPKPSGTPKARTLSRTTSGGVEDKENFPNGPPHGKAPMHEEAGAAKVKETAAAAAASTGAEGEGEEGVDKTGFEFKCGVLSADHVEGRVLAVAPGVGLREFCFDQVFSDGANQDDVYERAARPLIADFINGFNGTLLVYGQTGSGKTHTMFGTRLQGDTRGAVPRACEEVLCAVEERRRLGVSARLAVSYVEVYGNEVSDLLKGNAVVGQSRVSGQRYVLDGHAEQPVATMADVTKALTKGDAQKRRSATAMNDRSSRAHAVFVVTLTQTDEATGRELNSRLCLADLGGSEKLNKSKANDNLLMMGTVPWAEYYASRQLLTEAVNINAGLLSLKRCIDALHEGQKARELGKLPPHVPYQDSKLTMLLSPALGGDCKTVVLVTAAQEHAHAVETVQSLRFGERCSSLETRARVGSNALAAMIASLNEQIKALEEVVGSKEKWETVKVTRIDEVDGVEEVFYQSKQVGAEEERAKMERLIAERDFLSGKAAAATEGGGEATTAPGEAAPAPGVAAAAAVTA